MPDLDKLLDSALAFSEKGEKEKSLEIYHNILQYREDWSIIHYNIGLYHKYEGNWKESFKYNQRAVEIDPESESGQWNLGIAATMLQEWKIARRCWNFFGMKYEDTDEDPAGDIGTTPIRINPDGKGEVVWAKRIDPARAIIENIPFPGSGHRYADMVLNDGAPAGTRSYKGVEYSVLNELQLLQTSDYATYDFLCIFGSQDHYDLLVSMCREKDIEIENWTTAVRYICKKCSEGLPHHNHDEVPDFRDQEMTMAFASQSEEKITDVVNSWSRTTGADFREFVKYEQ